VISRAQEGLKVCCAHAAIPSAKKVQPNGILPRGLLDWGAICDVTTLSR
jgi:hypothetical protein